jgi:GNAT superfamily N-acetyltransferase
VKQNFSIRKATPGDLDEILHHRRSMFRDDGYTDDAALDAIAKHSRPLIQRGLSEGFYLGWFAVVDNEIAAGAGLLITDWLANPSSPRDARRAYVLNVYTYPKFRDRGLAKALMRTVIECCRQKGLTNVWLHASTSGRPVYEKMGFEPTNEMKLKLG